PLLYPDLPGLPADNFLLLSFRLLACIRQCVRSATRAPRATAAVRLAAPGSVLQLSPDSCCAHCSRATVRGSSSPVHGPCSPEPCVLAPIRLAPGSPSDRLVLSRCDASPDTATGDRSWPAAPESAHPGDPPSFDSLRFAAPCAR